LMLRAVPIPRSRAILSMPLPLALARVETRVDAGWHAWLVGRIACMRKGAMGL
jgi:hypothetical protein